MARIDRFRVLRDHVNGCPYYRHLGFEVETVEEGYARLVMTVRPEHFQFQGAVHGGAVYSIADAAVAIALLTLAEEGQHVLTIEGKVNFLAPVTEGEIVAEGRIIHPGRSVAVGEADVYLRGREGLVAKGLVTYGLRRPKR